MGQRHTRLGSRKPASANSLPSLDGGNKGGPIHESLLRERDLRSSFDEIYEVIEEIGQGGLCQIYKIRKRDDKIGGSSRPDLVRRPRLVPRLPSARLLHRDLSSSSPLYFALKIINLKLISGGSEKINQLKNEVEMLKTLDHPSIIKAYETFVLRDTKQLAIIMELCTGGDLYARMPYTEQQVAVIMKQILNALGYLHALNTIHRDVKMENIMFESEHPEAAVKVIDFGLSTSYSKSESVLKERVGTLYSMAPETMRGNYTVQADLWSVGVLAFIMFSGGDKPFDEKTPKQLVAKVMLGQYEFVPDSAWAGISDGAKDFVRKLLVVNVEDRMTASEALRHPFIAQCYVGRARESLVDEEFKQRVREGIVRYSAMSDFRKLALNVIAKKSSASEIFKLRKVFEEFDTLNTGTITLEEFKDALSKFDYSEEDLYSIFQKVDVNKTNEINYTEFLAAALEVQGTIEEYRLAEAFDLIDSDDSGYITRDDLRRILGENTDDTYIDQLIAEADFKKDGRIGYDEFLQVFAEKKHDRIYTMYEKSRSNTDLQPSSEKAEEVLDRFGLIPKKVLRVKDSDSFEQGVSVSERR